MHPQCTEYIMLNAVCYLQSHTIVFLTEIVACGTAEECKAACGIVAGCSNFAYVSMVIGIMPTGMYEGMSGHARGYRVLE